ncbi:MAG: hypothetical protein ABJP82_08890 [Hyphomicrobiales bacterium]
MDRMNAAFRNHHLFGALKAPFVFTIARQQEALDLEEHLIILRWHIVSF